MTCSTQVGEDAAIEGSITRIGGWVAEESSAAPPGRFDTDAAVAQSTCKHKGRGESDADEKGSKVSCAKLPS